MRNDIYYWKCDSPQSVTQKRQSYFQNKYQKNMEMVVKAVACDFRGEEPVSIKALGCDGNHFAYFIDYPEKNYFFRAADNSCDDDYMMAESYLMGLAVEHAIPVPTVYKTVTDTSRHGIKYQIMDRVKEPCLNTYHKDQHLDVAGVAGQLGTLLKRLHSIELDGFGFIDTKRLRLNDTPTGLDHSYIDYFEKCLDKHIGYLGDHELLDKRTLNDIIRLLERNRPLLNRERGCLVHRDPALWNVLGTPAQVTALIDWDDAVSGDPADDLGVLWCFYDKDFMEPFIAAYNDGNPLSEDFNRRVWLHCLRNMLWKIMIRDYMGYFEKSEDFFLNGNSPKVSLRDYSVSKLKHAMMKLRE